MPRRKRRNVRIAASSGSLDLYAMVATIRIRNSLAPPDVIPPPPVLGDYGPQELLVPPTVNGTTVIEVLTTDNLKTKTDAAPAGTTFVLRAGVHSITSVAGMCTPKTGNVYFGEYGAILDGSSWSSTDQEHAAIISNDGGVTGVTIKNIVVRNMPIKGIYCAGSSTGWTIEYNEIDSCMYGVEFSSNTTVQHNYIHHNEGDPSGPTITRGGGYVARLSEGALVFHNEISYNGQEQKISLCAVTFRENFVHHNRADGIWYDTNHTTGHNILVEDNTVEDNGRDGISMEDVIGGEVRNNTCSRNGEGILLHAGQEVYIHHNTFTDNTANISFYIDLSSSPEDGRDLRENVIEDNVVNTTSAFGVHAAIFTYAPGLLNEELPYVNNSKNTQFDRNIYHAVNTTDTIFMWGQGGGNRNFASWQGLGFDLNGSID